MTLLNPNYLWIIIPLAFFLWRGSFSFTNKIHIIILALIIITLARPIINQTPQEKEIEAKDIIIALDISFSMNAKDILPNRYQFARETIKEILKANPTDNIMLIAFTSNPIILSPPTTDHKLILTALKSLNREFILTKGTSLERLFKLLIKMEIEDKNLILITDGGEDRELHKLKSLINNFNLTILGVGTEEGITVENSKGELIRDKQNNLVISRLNPILEHLSTSYISPSSPKQSAKEIYKSLVESDKKIQKTQYSHLELYQIPLGLAMLLFFFLHTNIIDRLRRD